jgi:hypothetical protein
MDSKDKEVKDLQQQWAFLAIGSLLALIAGILVNALYELIRETNSLLHTIIFSAVLFLFFLDIFSYMFENLKVLRKEEKLTFYKVFKRYFKFRINKILRRKV